MRYSIHSILRSAALLLLVGVIFLGCNEITTAPTPDLSPADVDGLTSEASASKRGKRQTSRMNDRFATEDTGAQGTASVVLTQSGGIVIDRVKVVHLLPTTPYLLNVTVVPPGGSFPADVVSVSTSPVSTNSRGAFDIGFDLGAFASGIGYRVDIFVTHDPPSGAGSGAVGAILTALLGGDPLLACQPAYSVVVI